MRNDWQIIIFIKVSQNFSVYWKKTLKSHKEPDVFGTLEPLEKKKWGAGAAWEKKWGARAVEKEWKKIFTRKVMIHAFNKHFPACF